MGTASVHEGGRMRFSDLLDRAETQEAASEVLGISVRTFQRWAERFEAEGDDGLADRCMGRRSPRRAAEEELGRMLRLFRDKYPDFTAKHFHEQAPKSLNRSGDSSVRTIQTGCDLDNSCAPRDMISETFTAMIKHRSSIMPALFDLLYREYCRARLAEMRKQLLLRTDSNEVPEANCDASNPDGAADRSGGLVGLQHEAGRSRPS
jgi:transposase